MAVELKIFDLVIFKSGGTPQALKFGDEKITIEASSFTHVGIVVNSELFPNKSLLPGVLYILESVYTGVVKEYSASGLLLRPLTDALAMMSKLGMSYTHLPLIHNPWPKDDIVESKTPIVGVEGVPILAGKDTVPPSSPRSSSAISPSSPILTRSPSSCSPSPHPPIHACSLVAVSSPSPHARSSSADVSSSPHTPVHIRSASAVVVPSPSDVKRSPASQPPASISIASISDMLRQTIIEFLERLWMKYDRRSEEDRKFRRKPAKVFRSIMIDGVKCRTTLRKLPHSARTWTFSSNHVTEIYSMLGIIEAKDYNEVKASDYLLYDTAPHLVRPPGVIVDGITLVQASKEAVLKRGKGIVFRERE